MRKATMMKVFFGLIAGALSGCAVYAVEPAPRHAPERRTAQMGAEEAVYGCPKLKGNGELIVLQPGTYRCKLEVKGNGNVVRGAGRGRTFIDGKLEMKGNRNVAEDLTVLGKTELKGNDNVLVRVTTRGGLEVKGHGHGHGHGKKHGKHGKKHGHHHDD